MSRMKSAKESVDLEQLRESWKKAVLDSPVLEVSFERRRELGELEARTGYLFRELRLLELALTHKSFANEAPGTSAAGGGHYEAMEFLGDAILELLISELLLLSFPSKTEGELSKLRSYLVSTAQLSRLSRRLELGSYLKLSQGEEKTGGRQKKAILADVFESLTAGIYLDGGLEAARRFILHQVEPLREEISSSRFSAKDSKSRLQEKVQRAGWGTPSYLVLKETGPDHCKQFLIEVRIAGKKRGEGRGKSKKEAEHEAASQALAGFRELELEASEKAGT